VTDAGLKELAGLKGLQQLYLGGTEVTDAGLKELAGLKRLQRLHLGGRQVTDAGLKELAGLKGLQTLGLGGTKVADAGLTELAGLKGLQTLDLHNTQVTDAGLKELAGLRALQRLDLGHTQVTDAGAAELQKALPTLTIVLAAPAAFADAKYVKIIHVETGKVLAVAKDSDQSGARAVLAKDDNNKARQWKLEKDGDYYKVINRKSGKALDVFEVSSEEGAPIIVWDEKTVDTDNQRWSWERDGKDRRLRTKLHGFVLDVDDEGKLIQQKADEKAKGQLWRVVEVKE
jgi:Ricin-type beta-trefoil lectin domain-like/Leucine Rich repeat